MKHVLHIFFFLCSICYTLSSAGQDVWRHYSVSDGLTTNEVRQVVELPNGQVMVNCEGAFCLFDGMTFHTMKCDRSLIHPLSNYIGYAHLWQGDSLLWLRDFYHLYLFDTRTLAFRYDVEQRLKDPRIAALADGEGTYELPDERWRLLADSIGATSKVEHAMRDRQGGIWLGTHANGLFYVYPEKQRAKVVHDNLLERQISGMTDSQGHTWHCTMEGLQVSPAIGGETCFTQRNTTGFLHSRMIFITALRDGRYLLCNHGHYFGYFDPEARTFTPLNSRLPQLENYRWGVGACQIADDRVLVYTQNGAFLLDTRADTLCDFAPAREIARWSEKYNCAVQDHEGRLWIGTQNGLFLIHNPQFIIHNCADVVRVEGLANNCIRSLVEDKEGNIWVGTECGISGVRKGEVINLGPADGVPQVRMKERDAALLDDGCLVFAQQTMGLITFRPEWFAADSTSYPVHPVGLEVNGQPHPSITGGDGGGSFPHTQNHLTFRFSALNYAAPEHTRYRYRLTGLDDEWLYDNSGTGLATATYNALPPGDYVFEAQCAVAGGEWGGVLSIPFTIRPPWWLTWWMKTVYGLVVLVILLILINQIVKRKRKRLEAEAEERVNRLFELREEARHQFVENVRIDASKIGVSSEEEALVGQLLKAIESNLDNSEYSVDQLARDVALGRTNLYKRVQTMLGITPNDFIRSVRLKRAAVLLSDTNLSIVEISERVGFNSPRYFSASFKTMFGVTPSEYREPKENL